MDDTVFANNLLDRIQQLTRDVSKLQRKLGRCAWHRNQARKRVAELQAELVDMKAAKDGLARQLGKEQKKLAELEAAHTNERTE